MNILLSNIEGYKVKLRGDYDCYNAFYRREVGKCEKSRRRSCCYLSTSLSERGSKSKKGNRMDLLAKDSCVYGSGNGEYAPWGIYNRLSLLGTHTKIHEFSFPCACNCSPCLSFHGYYPPPTNWGLKGRPWQLTSSLPGIVDVKLPLLLMGPCMNRSLTA